MFLSKNQFQIGVLGRGGKRLVVRGDNAGGNSRIRRSKDQKTDKIGVASKTMDYGRAVQARTEKTREALFRDVGAKG